jgi:hypothetical protein
MPRIVYLLFSDGGVAGGHKMILRHVETLCDLGFDAVAYIGQGNEAPTWLEHHAPLAFGTPVRADDIIVVPDDAEHAVRTCLNSSLRTVIFSQSLYNFAGATFDLFDQFPAERFPPIIAISRGHAEIIQRVYPHARIEITPCFADERRFTSRVKRPAIACTPRKRPLEVVAIRQFLRRFHPRHAGLEWLEMRGAPEDAVAAAFGEATLHLSLSRLEAVGITALEAMAAGCVCAGFTGVGGRQYATADNGFWADEDDCIAAADALAAAADLVAAGGPPLERMLAAGQATAEAWSYARFREGLEQAWMQIAPEARVRAASAS